MLESCTRIATHLTAPSLPSVTKFVPRGIICCQTNIIRWMWFIYILHCQSLYEDTTNQFVWRGRKSNLIKTNCTNLWRRKFYYQTIAILNQCNLGPWYNHSYQSQSRKNKIERKRKFSNVSFVHQVLFFLSVFSDAQFLFPLAIEQGKCRCREG